MKSKLETTFCSALSNLKLTGTCEDCITCLRLPRGSSSCMLDEKKREIGIIHHHHTSSSNANTFIILSTTATGVNKQE